jgi:hypothetical protein
MGPAKKVRMSVRSSSVAILARRSNSGGGTVVLVLVLVLPIHPHGGDPGGRCREGEEPPMTNGGGAGRIVGPASAPRLRSHRHRTRISADAIERNSCSRTVPPSGGDEKEEPHGRPHPQRARGNKRLKPSHSSPQEGSWNEKKEVTCNELRQISSRQFFFLNKREMNRSSSMLWGSRSKKASTIYPSYRLFSWSHAMR